MGNSQKSNAQREKSAVSTHWEQLSPEKLPEQSVRESQYIRQLKNVYIDKANSHKIAQRILIELQDIRADKLEEEVDLQLYGLRKSNPKIPVQIVRVFEFYKLAKDNHSKKKHQEKKLQGESNEAVLEIYMEFTPIRLSDITSSLSHTEGLYILEESLLGFQWLFQTFGYFPVENSMIGFNWHGEVRVWFNRFFHLNKFFGKQRKVTKIQQVLEKQLETDISDEYRMVSDIWICLCKQSLFIRDFIKESGGFYHTSFERGLQIVREQKQKVDVRMPKSMPSHLEGIRQIKSRLENDHLKWYMNNLTSVHSPERSQTAMKMQQKINTRDVEFISSEDGESDSFDKKNLQEENSIGERNGRTRVFRRKPIF